MSLSREQLLAITKKALKNYSMIGPPCFALVTDAVLAAINKPLTPGVEWDSPKFWQAFAGNYAAMDLDGDVWGSDGEPSIGRRSSVWDVDYGMSKLNNMNITNLPDKADWQDSKIKRPSTWHWPVPDDDTPVDAREWVRREVCDPWLPRYSAGGKAAFNDGKTSWSVKHRCVAGEWNMTVLADPENLHNPPPMGLVPGGGE